MIIRNVTKISNCQVNTDSKYVGIKQLGISQGSPSSQLGDIPGPQSPALHVSYDDDDDDDDDDNDNDNGSDSDNDNDKDNDNNNDNNNKNYNDNNNNNNK